jgi:probable HAF family extracellular repeat protein
MSIRAISLLIALGALAAPASAQTPSSFISWYQAEGNTSDTEGANPGTAEGSLAYAPGAVGQAFSLTGGSNGGYISVTNPTLNAQVTGFSVAGWFVINSYTGFASFFNLRNASNNSGFTIEQNASTPGWISFDVVKASGVTSAVTSTGWALNTPYFIVATFDAASGAMRVYRNGALVGIRTDAAENMAPTSAPILNIGRNIVSGETWNGLIDEVRVYPYAVSAAGALSLASPDPGLVSWYRAENNTLDAQSLNNGNAQGSVPYARGSLGQGFALAGAGYVDIPSPTLNLNATAFSISAWITLESYAGNASLLNFRDVNNNSGFTLEQDVNDPGNINFNVNGAGSLASAGWALHTPYYIAATFDGINGVLCIYRNGTLIASRNVPPNSMAVVGSPDVQIGRNISGGDLWNGKIDEVRFYRGALTQPAVAALAVYDVFTITDLANLGYSGDTYSTNDAGQIAGSFEFGNNTNLDAALFTAGGTPLGLGILGATFSQAFGINSAGQTVGYSATSGGYEHAVLFTPGAPPTDLGSFGGKYTEAMAINDLGQIAGDADLGNTAHHATLLSADGSPPTDLGTLGGAYSYVSSINNVGQIAGWSYLNGNNVVHAALFQKGVAPIDLVGSGGMDSQAFGINDFGQIVGWIGNTVEHATLFTLGSSPTDLGTLGGTSSEACGINNAGEIVGNSYTKGNITSAGFIYTLSGGMRDINTLVGLSPIATSITFNGISLGSGIGSPINNWGQIAAQGKEADGNLHALLLNPTAPNVTVSGAAQDSKLIARSAYSAAPAFTNPSGLLSVIRLLDGTAGSGGASTYGQNRDVTETFTSDPATPLASDAVNLQGTATDLVVVQLSYNESTAINLFGKEANARLGWYDGKHWVNAVDGNAGSAALPAGDRAYNAATDFHLGTYGIDSANNVVWAVVNHGGLFGVTLDPNVLKTTKSVSRTGTQTTVTMDSFTGHVYQLQRADSLTGGTGFAAADANQQNGATGTVLSFTHDDGAATQAFYRVLLDP